MVRFYVDRIRAGKMTLEQVPTRWREAVREALDEEKKGDEHGSAD